MSDLKPITNHEELYRAIGNLEGCVGRLCEDMKEIKNTCALIPATQKAVNDMQPHVDDYVDNKNKFKGILLASYGLFAVALSVLSYLGIHIENPFK